MCRSYTPHNRCQVPVTRYSNTITGVQTTHMAKLVVLLLSLVLLNGVQSAPTALEDTTNPALNDSLEETTSALSSDDSATDTPVAEFRTETSQDETELTTVETEVKQRNAVSCGGRRKVNKPAPVAQALESRSQVKEDESSTETLEDPPGTERSIQLDDSTAPSAEELKSADESFDSATVAADEAEATETILDQTSVELQTDPGASGSVVNEEEPEERSNRISSDDSERATDLPDNVAEDSTDSPVDDTTEPIDELLEERKLHDVEESTDPSVDDPEETTLLADDHADSTESAPAEGRIVQEATELEGSADSDPNNDEETTVPTGDFKNLDVPNDAEGSADSDSNNDEETTVPTGDFKNLVVPNDAEGSADSQISDTETSTDVIVSRAAGLDGLISRNSGTEETTTEGSASADEAESSTDIGDARDGFDATETFSESNTEQDSEDSTEVSFQRSALSSSDSDELEGSGFSVTTEADFVEFPSRRETRRDFSKYRVYRVILPSEEAVERFLKLEEEPGIEFWADPKLLLRPRGLFVMSAADILAAPDVVEHLEAVCDEYKVPYSVLIPDVQEAINKENPSDEFDAEELQSRIGHSLTWDRYHRLENIYSFIEYVARTYPNMSTVTEIGKTYEGRPLKMLKLHHEGGRTNKKAIFMDAGIHAREWITPAVLTYIIRELAENPTSDCILNDFDWHFVPVVNPDGYEFTHSTDRMWRKSRSPIRRAQTSRSSDSEQLRRAAYRYGSDCFGTDLNRNFDFKWRTGGSSRHPCSMTYAGENASSEPETQALAQAILNLKDDAAMYVSLHAYSQMWLLPWGYTSVKPDDFSDLFSLARIGGKALEKVHKTNYLIGSIPDLLYVASGSSQDWAKGVAGIKYSYTLELRDAGDYGFLLPASQIEPTSEETWAGLLATAKELARRVYGDAGSCE